MFEKVKMFVLENKVACIIAACAVAAAVVLLS